MTRKTIHFWFIAAVIYFAVLIIIGVIISIADQANNRVLYSTFKDLIPLLISMPAVWLGYCVQRRSAYLQQLRSLWSRLIDAVHSSLQYTYLREPKQSDHLSVLLKLSSTIDEVRGLFCNLEETGGEGGFYPFEPLKDIHGLLEDLGYEKSFPAKKDIAREKAWALWKDVRQELLKEFDREEPTFSHSHWLDLAKSRVYEENNISKTVT